MTASMRCHEASPTPQLVEIEPIRGIAVDGVAPGGPAHMHAINVLY
jgi:hypothetical protein